MVKGGQGIDMDLSELITQTDANGQPISSKRPPTSSPRRALARKPQVAPNNSSLSDERSYSSDSGDLNSTSSFVNSLHAMCCFPEAMATESTSSLASADREESADMSPERRSNNFYSSATKKKAERSSKVQRHSSALLPHKNSLDQNKMCLVLDLDETLVHSSFKAVPWADFAIPVKIGDQSHFVYVTKRPGVDEFLTEMAKYYELIVYTASRDKYANPLLDILDEKNVIRTRLFREDCLFYEGTYVKDLSKLGRDLRETIIVDNAPHSYTFHPENAIGCSSFIDDPMDRELYQIGAFLKEIRNVKDVRNHCSKWVDFPNPALAAPQHKSSNPALSYGNVESYDENMASSSF